MTLRKGSAFLRPPSPKWGPWESEQVFKDGSAAEKFLAKCEADRGMRCSFLWHCQLIADNFAKDIRFEDGVKWTVRFPCPGREEQFRSQMHFEALVR